MKKNNVVEWPAGWDHAAYNTVSAAENWVSNYNNDESNPSSDFQASKDLIGIAQLQLDGVNVQNQLVLAAVVGGPAAQTIPEPASILVWSLIACGGWLGMRIWRRKGAAVA